MDLCVRSKDLGRCGKSMVVVREDLEAVARSI